MAAWGIKTHQFVLACFALVLTLISARSFTICRNQYQIGMFAYCSIIGVGLFALALGWIPASTAPLPLLAATVLFFLIFKKRPSRMDYNLFLRAAHGLLKTSEATNDSPQANRFDRRKLLAFARFLGSRFLASNFRWEPNGLTLRLPPVGNRFLINMAAVFMPPISRNCSHILLSWNGTVVARCGDTDARDLVALKTSHMTNTQELEGIVAESVGQAWQGFRDGNLAAAERLLGDSPESEVFVVPPARSKSLRWWRVFIGASVLLMLTAIILQFWRPAWLSNVKTVTVTKAQVRASLASFGHESDGDSLSNGLTQFLYYGFVLPPTNLFAPEVIQAVRKDVFKAAGFDPDGTLESKYERLGNAGLLGKAVAGGWISFDEVGVAPSQMSEALHNPKPYGWKFHFELAHRQCSYEGTNYMVQQVDSLVLGSSACCAT